MSAIHYDSPSGKNLFDEQVFKEGNDYYVWRSQLDKKQYLDSAIGEALYKKYANDDKRNRYSGKR